MAISVVMPALELAQETGKVVAWRKKEGESVLKGEPLLEIETDKAVVEIESPGDGTLAGVSAQVGDVIPVGKTIGWLIQPGERLPTSAAEPHFSARVKTEAVGPAQAVKREAARSSNARANISPKARRLAQERGVDIGRVIGSGPDGEILAADILAAAQSQHEQAGTSIRARENASGVQGLSAVGRLMAERTTQSWASVPHFFVVRAVDAGALNKFREQLAANRGQSSHVTVTDLLTAIVARVLVKHRRLNAIWTNQGVSEYPDINIGLAVAVKDGVVSVVIRNANRATLVDIANQRHELSERARAGRSRPADITSATFTISNLGMYDVDAFTAIVTPAQSAILAVGRIADRVVAVEGKPAVRPMMTMTLSCDHRVLDGARAAQFLSDLTAAIESPAEILE